MAIKVCAVFDKAVEAYGQPFFVRALGEAQRQFIDAINDEKTPYHAHPGDYDLYHLGDYDDASGLLVACTPPKRLSVGKETLIEKS